MRLDTRRSYLTIFGVGVIFAKFKGGCGVVFAEDPGNQCISDWGARVTGRLR